jgi:hypothetical protein
MRPGETHGATKVFFRKIRFFIISFCKDAIRTGGKAESLTSVSTG